MLRVAILRQCRVSRVGCRVGLAAALLLSGFAGCATRDRVTITIPMPAVEYSEEGGR